MKRQTIRSGNDLLQAGIINQDQVDAINEVSKTHSMAVTPELLSLINPEDSEDPIARQFIPTREELHISSEELADPIGDEPFTPIKGITHRYPDRVLLKPVHVCPAYCRFCFRREKVGIDGEGLSPSELNTALDYIRQHSEIWEVILTGGDPLILSKPKLKEIIWTLDAIAHVEVIRIHTRVPVVDPARIDADLVRILKVNTPVYVVLHTNHPLELTSDAQAVCSILVDAGIPMLSQTVLLKGVNDDLKTMSQLMRILVRNRIKPYYLHQADLARGTSHMRTSIAEGQALMRAMRGDVSGICQPTYVLDIPGGYGKVPIGPQYLTEDGEDYLIEDPCSRVHHYPLQKNQ